MPEDWPAFVFIGYRVLGPPAPASAAKSPAVREICTMAGCMRGSPEGAEMRWEGFNAASCYDTVEAAKAVMTGEAEHTVFAYRLLPVLFARGREPVALDLAAHFGEAVDRLPSEPTAGFESLGFDAIGVKAAEPAKGGYAPSMAMWNCSPLSCNGLAGRYPVNAWCLLDRLEDAAGAARDFARGETEPGPYVVVEVLRMREESR